jgi:dolichol-phosphate mannosyltransferase
MEVPFRFGERFAGKSKASSKEAYKYLYLLLRLRFGEKSLHFLGFALVGFSGIFVNTLALAFFTSVLGIHYLVSAVFATIFSTTWNFALTEFWVFGSRNSSGRIKRYALFFAMNNLALLLRGPIMYALTSWAGIHYLISNLISLAVLVILRFLLADSWIWGKAGSGKDTAQSLL